MVIRNGRCRFYFVQIFIVVIKFFFFDGTISEWVVLSLLVGVMSPAEK